MRFKDDVAVVAGEITVMGGARYDFVVKIAGFDPLDDDVNNIYKVAREMCTGGIVVVGAVVAWEH